MYTLTLCLEILHLDLLQKENYDELPIGKHV